VMLLAKGASVSDSCWCVLAPWDYVKLA